MTSDAHQVVFLSAKTLGNNQFPNDVVRALKEFLAFLAGRFTVDHHVECHKVLNLRPTHTPSIYPRESPMNPARNPQ